MNEQDIEEVRDVIEYVMTDYIFEPADERTLKAITKDIASSIHIYEFYDYLLEATVDQDNIVIDLCIKPTDSEDFTYFTASYTDTPVVRINDKIIEEHKETFDNFDSAMKVI